MTVITKRVYQTPPEPTSQVEWGFRAWFLMTTGVIKTKGERRTPLTKKQVARMFKVSTRTVERWLKAFYDKHEEDNT